jgi:hypothetical protein|tara:strand:+ start:327 stop:737 length:411 start_codon:yes stop_codon:yes gene_type:complete
VLSNTALAGSNKPTDTTGTIGSMPTPKLLGDDLKYSMPAFLWRHTQFMKFRLNKEEKSMHQSAVFFMLQDVPNGKIVSWYSKKRLANGKVRVIHSYPISGGYCRTYQAYIKINGKERHMTNNACKYIGSPSWSFYN